MPPVDAIPRPRRILVVGSTAAGKSTLARRLSTHYGLPFVSLDVLHWGPNWTPRPEFRDEVMDWIARDAWVMEGGYGFAAATAWPRAEQVVWLDLSFPRLLCQLLLRTIRRRLRNEEIFGGNRESLRMHFFSKDSLILWLMKTFRARRREYGALCAQHPAVPVVRLRTRRALDTWQDGLNYVNAQPYLEIER